jgi:hypothetical protein
MAQQKKGCGFLITALIILIVGGGIATYLGISTANTVKEFSEDIQKGKVFIAPATLDYTAPSDGEVTVWMTGDGSDDLTAISIEVTDVATGKTSTHGKSNQSSNMGNQHLVTTFTADKDKKYKLKSVGAAAGKTFRVSNVSSSAVFAILGKGFGAFGAAGIAGFLALIFGIIGLVKFLGSKNAVPTPTPPAV